MKPTKHDSLKNDYRLKLVAAHESAKQALKKLGEMALSDQMPGPFHKTKRLVMIGIRRKGERSFKIKTT